jgi:Neuraminidase (sialidase)
MGHVTRRMNLAILALVLLSATRSWAALGFTPPTTLNTNADSDTQGDWETRVATDGLGNWVAVWYSGENLGGTIGTDHDIFVSRSADDGLTWTAPAALNTNASSDSGDDGRPHVTADGSGNWVATWESFENLGGVVGTDLDIFVSRSIDNGVIWSTPATLNTNADSDSGPEQAPQVTTDGLGNWVAVWVSGENLGGTAGIDNDIFVSRSTDDGVTWTAPATLNTNSDSDSGHDGSFGFPQVATDGLGNWIAVWSSPENLGGTIGTDWDIFVSRSSDSGATWSAPETLNTNASSDVWWDEDPKLTTDGSGNWVCVWWSNENLGGTAGTDGDIFFSCSTNNGTTWSTVATLNTNADSDSGGDYYPCVSTDGSGHWVTLWNSDENLNGTAGTDNDIFASHSTDNGVTWTDPATLNTNADSDSGMDFDSQVRADASGNWIAVWTSAENLSGTAGTDIDIFVSTSSAVPVELSVFGAE